MTLRALTLLSERWLDQVTFTLTYAEGAGDINDKFSLPNGTGDVAVIEIDFFCAGIATVAANPELMAVRFTITDAASGANLDIIGTEPFRKIAPAIFATYHSPDPLVIWRQNEHLNIVHMDIDTNGAPTVTGNLILKCVRVRPDVQQTQPSRAPLRLVR